MPILSSCGPTPPGIPRRRTDRSLRTEVTPDYLDEGRRWTRRSRPTQELEQRLARLHFALNAADPKGAVARGRKSESFGNNLKARRNALLKTLAKR